LLIAKDLVSADTLALVFGASAEQNADSSASHAARQPPIPPGRKPGTMTAPTVPIGALIEDAQTKHLAAQDKLNEHLAASPDDPDDASLATRDALVAAADSAKRNLESLYATERALSAAAVPGAARTEPAQGRAVAPSNSGSRVFAAPAKNITPADRALHVLAGLVCSWASKGQKSVYDCIAERYGHDGKIEEKTKILADMALRREGTNAVDVVQRAATAPATTTTSGWASQLVETSTQGWTNLLMPAAVFPGLASRAIRLNFGRAGIISVPTRAATPTIAGSFVAEGSPIPVRQAAFTSQTFGPKKMAVITSFTREIAEHSNPTLEGLLRMAIQEDTSVSLDTVLIDATAATAVRPAGIRAGVSVTTATAGGGFNALVGDLKALVGALMTSSNGNLRSPVWIMNPVQALSVSLTQNAGGDFPFQADINNGTLLGYSFIRSSTVPAGMLILVDSADFVVLEGAAPRFDLSDQTVLVYDDTAPAQIGTTGSPAVVGAPARSMFQTDSIALRMIFDVNWGLVRTGTVAWTQAVTW
jgi:HK97 family phage major capsid protein